jgi:predicted NAD/FAD-dependent oxidoreductase
MVKEWETAGAVREWCRGFPADTGPRLCDGHTRYKAVGGMTALAKHLARDLEVHLEKQAASLAETPNGWQVRTKEGETFEGDSLLITAPVPQALELLNTCNRKPPAGVREALARIEYDPCLTILLVLSHAADIPEPGAVRFSDGPVAFLTDNHRKGLSPHTFAVTIQTSPEFSRDHWESDDETINRLLIPHVRQWLDPAHIKTFQVKRWKYSVPLEVYPEPCLEVFSKPSLLLAGDGFGGPRIEGAVLSGLAAAEKLLGTPVTSSES